MTANRSALFDVTQELQEQSDIPHWMVGSSSTVLAIASKDKEMYGWRGRWFALVFGALGVTTVARLTLQIIASIAVTVWWLKCRNVASSESETDALFVGFGAGPRS